MTDAIAVKTTVRFKPFAVPDHATIELSPRPKQDGMQPLPTIPIEELDRDVLDALASRWLDNLYAACKRRSPFFTATPAESGGGK